MIIRIVKMTFSPEMVNEFLFIFDASKVKIIGFEGCSHLSLLKQTTVGNVYFTYSYWESEAHLNNYRNSELFKSTWAKTKILFSAAPEAYSMNTIETVENLQKP